MGSGGMRRRQWNLGSETVWDLVGSETAREVLVDLVGSGGIWWDLEGSGGIWWEPLASRVGQGGCGSGGLTGSTTTGVAINVAGTDGI
mmetsp:Transcript_7659/g.17140  ORF Transcript_7659/g.17140 Transcript_7659/m.17140 type:complete len:88 (+) Transcript_7659:1338-1601(+)